MPRDTRCNYCGNLYDHKTGVGHKTECRMNKKRAHTRRVRSKKLPNGTTLRVETFGELPKEK